MKLLVVIPFTAADLPAVENLFSCLESTGPFQDHDVLFVADRKLLPEQFNPLLKRAEPLFGRGELIRTPVDLPDESFPYGYNFRFETAAKHVEQVQKQPWLWLDPRCVPMRRGWLREIEEAYFAARKPFFGQFLEPLTHGTPATFLSAVAVYPATLPKRMLQRLVVRRQTEWEKSCAELSVPDAAPTNLIWTQPSGTGRARECLPQDVPQEASLAHTAACKMLSAALRGETVMPAPEPEPVEQPSPTSRAGFYHSGDLGDIIYSLAAIRLAGGGKLYLGPQQRRTPSAADPIKQPKFDLFEPLLTVQPYLSKVIFTERYPGTDNAFDLNTFRTDWGDKIIRAKTGISTLVRMHCWKLGVNEKFRNDDPWLTVPNPIRLPYYAIHRSARYRGTEQKPFPWQKIVKLLEGKLLFVGLPQEHADFQRDFGCTVAYWKPKDFLELARIIAGSEGFIGNQSFPNAIALACGQKVLQEHWPVSPDCLLIRDNFLSQPFSDSALQGWLDTKRIAVRATEPVKEAPPVEIISQPLRYVSKELVNGLIELGPLEEATGLGDTLTVTPLAAALGKRAVMCLPPEMQPYACLFDGLCPVRITDDYPVFQNPGEQRFIESKLRMFGIGCEDGKTAPVIRLTEDEIRAAKLALPNIRRTRIIFQTACAKRWESVRSRPAEFFEPIAKTLKAQRFSLTSHFATTPLREVAAQYAVIGRYLGVNTGNWHLAMAVGCKCLVMDAEKCEGYNPAFWRYDLANVRYVGFNQDNILAELPWITS